MAPGLIFFFFLISFSNHFDFQVRTDLSDSCRGWWDFLVEPRTQGLLLIFKTTLVTPYFYALGLPFKNIFCLFRKLHDCYFIGEKTASKQIKYYLNMTNQNKLWIIL